MFKREFIFVFVILMSFLASAYCEPAGSDVVKKSIVRHGGWEKFKNIRDFYAKMDVVSKTKKGQVESRVHQYFRLPDKLRAEIEPLIDPPTKISWDGESAWQLVGGKVRKTQNERQIQRLEESLRFLKLMVLTNLFEKGSTIKYQAHIKPKRKSYGIHVVSQTNAKGNTIKLYISDASHTLMGGESNWEGSTFKIFFDKHTWTGGLYLPRRTRLYRGNELVMTAILRLVRINKLANGHSFFSDLTESPKWLR